MTTTTTTTTNSPTVSNSSTNISSLTSHSGQLTILLTPDSQQPDISPKSALNTTPNQINDVDDIIASLDGAYCILKMNAFIF